HEPGDRGADGRGRRARRRRSGRRDPDHDGEARGDHADDEAEDGVAQSPPSLDRRCRPTGAVGRRRAPDPADRWRRPTVRRWTPTRRSTRWDLPTRVRSTPRLIRRTLTRRTPGLGSCHVVARSLARPTLTRGTRRDTGAGRSAGRRPCPATLPPGLAMCALLGFGIPPGPLAWGP